MRRHHPKQRFDPRSPVQPGRSSAPFLLLPVFAALSLWGLQQCSIQIPWPKAHSAANEPTREQSTATEFPARARGDVRGIFSDDDYPADAQRAGQEGTVQAKLDIDTSGRVARCTIIRSSGHASLDASTCKILLRRARFVPAQDRNGKATSDTYVTPPVTWRLQE